MNPGALRPFFGKAAIIIDYFAAKMNMPAEQGEMLKLHEKRLISIADAIDTLKNSSQVVSGAYAKNNTEQFISIRTKDIGNLLTAILGVIEQPYK